MPINWLSEIRDMIRSLKSSNDFQKDECFQMLHLFSNSSQDQFEPNEYLSQNSDSLNDLQSERETSRSRIVSPRPTAKSIPSARSTRKTLHQHMTEKHEIDRPIRYTSADGRLITSQRTPKNVRFNQPSSHRNQLSSGGSLQCGRNELQTMLREEITKLKKDYKASRETTLQMQQEIKTLRKQIRT